MSTVSELTARLTELERVVLGMKKEIGTLRGSERPAVAPGECTKDQDPEDCPFANTYRYQKGCRGASCKRANSEYYNRGGVRDQHKGLVETPVAKPKPRKAAPVTKKAAPKKVEATSKKATTTKPVVKKGLLKRA